MRASFGPGGNSDAFRLWGGKSVLEAPAFVKSVGLDVYEYEAGRGVPKTPEVFFALGDQARREGVKLTFHAPYFISLSSVEPEKRYNSIEYIRQSIEAAHLMGAGVIVVHTGSAAKITRNEAMKLAADTLYKTLESVETHGIAIGLETMGKINQLGTLDEVIELCKMSKQLVPVVDFGHLNARDLGGVFKTADDYYRIFDKIGSELSDETAQNLHCHFSKIEWTVGGEKRHLTFEDRVFGPDFEPLTETIARHGLSPTVISESAGTQSDDALTMKKSYLYYLENTL